jgi:riboflavin-specific deaminase-like protein
MSVDGFIGDDSSTRLVLSSPEDFMAMYRLRAESDAILVGGETIRNDNPSLATRHDELLSLRKSRGMSPHPVKVTITRTGNLPQNSRFFEDGDGPKLVFAGSGAAGDLEQRLGSRATVIRLPTADVRAHDIVSELSIRGVSQLMVEGGTGAIDLFLREGLVDAVRLAIAPVMCGSRGRSRPFRGEFPQWQDRRRIKLARVQALGDTSVNWYELERENAVLDQRNLELMELAFATAENCVPVASAYNVGAVLTTPDRVVLATGFSRETGSHEHAEEVAIRKALLQGATIEGAWLYVTLEPCGIRMSKPKSCSELALEHRVARVFYASHEPSLFVKQQSGLERLRRAGVEVIHMPGFEERFRRAHAHLLVDG